MGNSYFSIIRVIEIKKTKSLLPNNIYKDTVARILKQNKYRLFKSQFVHILQEGIYDRCLSLFSYPKTIRSLFRWWS